MSRARKIQAKIRPMHGSGQSSNDVQQASPAAGGRVKRKIQGKISGMRGSGRPSRDVREASSVAGGQLKRNAVAGREDMYKLAYAESQRTLDDQTKELDSMRDRAVQFAAFVGAATAFLVGTGLLAAHKDIPFYILAGAASTVSAIWILLLFLLLNPSRRKLWGYRMSSTVLIEKWIESDVPEPTEANFLRQLTRAYERKRESNEAVLSSLRRLYRWFIVAGSAQVTIWAAVVWLKR